MDNKQLQAWENFQSRWRLWQSMIIIALVLSAFSTALVGVDLFTPLEEVKAPAAEEMEFTMQSANVPIYREQGGTKEVYASGSELEIQSGATLDIQSGATVGILGGNPLLYASSGQELVCGTQTITGTADIVTGLSVTSYGVATMAADPSVGAGEAFLITVDAPSTTTLTVNLWQDDVNAATVGAAVEWCAVGTQ